MAKVILITGPGGAGKTTLAEYVGARNGVSVITEDIYWADVKRGHPEDEWRTEEEERLVQQAVIAETLKLLADGQDVVIEFILYRDPPRPLIAYREAFLPVAPVLTIALNPSAEAILERKRLRGREIERDIALETANTVHQLNCLTGAQIDHAWLVDNSALSVEEVYDRHIAPFLNEEAAQ